MSHPLDRPVWSALTTGWSHLAQGDDQALRIDPAYGYFAAASDTAPESLRALVALVPPGAPLWVVELEPPPVEGVSVQTARCHQMVAEIITPGEPDFEIVE